MKYIRPIVIVGFLLALTFNGLSIYKLHKNIKAMQAQLAVSVANIDSVRSKLDSLDSLPLSLAETPSGLKFVGANHGVTQSELDFLSQFRGPLLKKDQYREGAEQIDMLHQVMDSDFKKKKPTLASYSLSERSSRVAFAVLRTNGSMPVYAVRDRFSEKVYDALLRPSGNCSDFSLRLMLVLESIGLKAAMISNVTKNLPGHVFVDAYDPVTDVAYLLDANFNVMIEMPNTGGIGFVESLFKMDGDAKKALSTEIRILAFPVYFRYVDPGEMAFVSTPYSVDMLNELRVGRETLWRKWIANDVDELPQWWRKAPNHAPNTLTDIREEQLAEIPMAYNQSGAYARNIRLAAGVK